MGWLVWAEYGPARNERARGQNSINKKLKSLPNPKDTLFNTHIQIQRGNFSLTRDRQSH